MRTHLLAVALTCVVVCAQAAQIKEVQDDELNTLLRSVQGLIDKSDPRAFPAVIRLVALPRPAVRCPAVVRAEETCVETVLYVVLTNWDLEPNRQVFEVGAAASWRFISLDLDDGARQSLWSATLELEAQEYQGEELVARVVTLRVRDVRDQYFVSAGASP